MHIVAIIQSRMTSKRYPGKMLAPFLGKPVLFHIVQCLRRINFNITLILATSKDTADDPLAIYGSQLGLKIVRGSREDVMQRFSLVLSQNNCDAFFRVCGDSPLLQPFLFNEAIKVYKINNFDLVTNIFPRSFPSGMSVELIKTKTFKNNLKFVTNTIDREHITRYFYNNYENFKIHNIKCKKFSDKKINLALDFLEDLKKLEKWEQNRNEDYEKLFPVD